MQKANISYTNLTIRPSYITIPLLGSIVFLAIGHLTAHGITSFLDISPDQTFGLFEFFSMGQEANLPTFVSALNLLFASGLVAFIAHNKSNQENQYALYWWGLAIGLLIMGFDEAARIHEGIIEQFLLEFFGRGEGFFHYLWYIAYIPLVIIIGVLYVPFFRHLPLRYNFWIVLAGFIYLGGAVGFEMIESYLDFHNLSKGLNILIEETFEMLGIVILIHSLLIYITDYGYALKAQFALKDRSQKYSGGWLESPKRSSRTK